MENDNTYLGLRPGDLEGKPYAKFYGIFNYHNQVFPASALDL